MNIIRSTISARFHLFDLFETFRSTSRAWNEPIDDWIVAWIHLATNDSDAMRRKTSYRQSQRYNWKDFFNPIRSLLVSFFLSPVDKFSWNDEINDSFPFATPRSKFIIQTKKVFFKNSVNIYSRLIILSLRKNKRKINQYVIDANSISCWRLKIRWCYEHMATSSRFVHCSRSEPFIRSLVVYLHMVHGMWCKIVSSCRNQSALIHTAANIESGIIHWGDLKWNEQFEQYSTIFYNILTYQGPLFGVEIVPLHGVCVAEIEHRRASNGINCIVEHGHTGTSSRLNHWRCILP